MTVAPDGKHIFVPGNTAGMITTFDTATGGAKVTSVNGHPYSITIAPDGRHAFIIGGSSSSLGEGLVTPFDLATGVVGQSLATARIGRLAVVIDVAAPAEPAVDLTITPKNGQPNTFTIDPTASRSGLARIVSVAYDFSNGDVFSHNKPAVFDYQFRTPGTYTLSVTIADAEGRTATVRRQIQADSLSRKLSLLALSNLRYVTADDGGKQPLIPNRTAVGAWEKFEVVDLGGGEVAVRAEVNNRYLTVDPATKRVIASADAPVAFQYVRGANGVVSLKHKASGKYVSTNGDRQLTADRDAVGPWEQFATTLDTNAGWWSATGHYVCAEGGGNQPLIANRTQVGAWETFDVIDAGDGYVGFFAHANYRFVVAEDGGARPLVANRTAIGAWEKFRTARNPDGSQALIAAANNRYVAAENGGAAPLIANRTAVGAWESFRLPY